LAGLVDRRCSMAEIPNVCLRLANRPENVLVVRQALTGVAASLALGAIEANDLNTAVTEACNNVVLHAYDGDEGPLEVYLYALSDAIVVVVRDHGRGIERDAHADSDADGAQQERAPGIGLPVIEALSARSWFLEPPDGGTEVRMEFSAPAAAALVLSGEERPPEPASWGQPTPPGELELRLAPNALVRAVLPRVLSTLAARAHFSTDRISDVQLIADALGLNAKESITGSHLDVAVTVAQRHLQLRVGPLRSGHGEGLMTVAVDGFAPVVERLTDAKRVGHAEAGETLELRLVDQR
jgi:serine/threonine-protein kinase RsbW